MSTLTYDIPCLICDSIVPMKINDRCGISCVEAYHGEPEEYEALERINADAQKGENIQVKSRYKQFQTCICPGGHTMRFEIINGSQVGHDRLLTTPAIEDEIRCPKCEYLFGTVEDFNIEEHATVEEMNLKFVDEDQHPRYVFQKSLVRQDLNMGDKIAIPENCENCGNMIYFHYAKPQEDTTNTKIKNVSQ
jgi:hypothetical protein